MPDDLRRLKGAIFDLDGVITDTAGIHAAAWKALIDGYLQARAEREGREAFQPFDPEEDYRRYVDGKPRAEGLRSFLEARGLVLPYGEPSDPPDRETVSGLAHRKDALFQEVLDDRGVKVFPGTVALARRLRAAGVRIGVASSSRSCGQVLRRAGLDALFQVRVDGETVQELGLTGKPDPDLFLEAADRLGVSPERTAVFEDATAGVEAACRGAFGAVVGVAVDGRARCGLREAGADLVWEVERVGDLPPALLDAWVEGAGHRRPSALARWAVLARYLSPRRPVVFLDYDGTLAPIVERPELAVLPPDTRDVVRRLADRFPTTLVSGRGREDVARLADLTNVGYAGSHGFDIRAAGGEGGEIRHRVAEEIVPVVEAVTRELGEALAGVEGALVEPKGYTVAVHYRRVSPGERGAVESAVDESLRRHPELRKAHGKAVFELRPRIDWDKGKAVLWLLEALELEGDDVVPLYIGDDTTDEDAFRALPERGIGILVSEAPRPTEARYRLQDPGEVREFLARLADL